MKTRDKIIKRLAEKYYYGKRVLSAEEREVLEKSKYKDLLGPEREYHEFNKILENFAETSNINASEIVDQPVKKNIKFNMFQSKLPYIKDLIDEVEDFFKLDVNNFKLDRYQNIDVNVLKKLVTTYVKNNNFEDALKHEVLRCLTGNNAWNILYRLRYLLVR